MSKMSRRNMQMLGRGLRGDSAQAFAQAATSLTTGASQLAGLAEIAAKKMEEFKPEDVVRIQFVFGGDGVVRHGYGRAEHTHYRSDENRVDEDDKLLLRGILKWPSTDSDDPNAAKQVAAEKGEMT